MGRPSLDEIFGDKPQKTPARPSLDDIFSEKPKPANVQEGISAKLKERQAKDPSNVLGDLVMRGLDYVGGATRTAAFTPAEYLSGNITKEQAKADAMAALEGKAPTTSEHLGRMGMPEGAARGVLGFAGDVVLDPLSGAIKVGKKGLQAIGKAVFKSPTDIAKLDTVVSKFGKRPVSDVFLEHNISGNMNTISKKAKKVADKLGEEAGSILKKADARGATVDIPEAMSPIYQEARGLLNDADPKVVEGAQDLLSKVTEYMRPGTNNIVSASKASSMKSNLYKQAGEKSWEVARQTPETAKIAQKMGLALREATEKSVQQATGKGGVLRKVNDDWGTLLTANKTLTRAAGREAARPAVTQIDGIMALAAATGDPMAMAAMAGKTGVKMGRLPGVRTRVGSAMYKTGKPGIAKTMGEEVGSRAFRRGLLNYMNQGDE